MKKEMEFNKETFDKALKANKIVRYQQHFEAVVKSYLEIHNQALRIHDVVGQSERFCSCSFVMIMRDVKTHVPFCSECGKEVSEQN